MKQEFLQARSIIADSNSSELEKQNAFLDCYRVAEGRDRISRKLCDLIGLKYSTFQLWLADPAFEEPYWTLNRSHSYELSEQLQSNAYEALNSEDGISKGRFYNLTIAQKSTLELLKSLNRERFGENQTINLKAEHQVIPMINISLIGAEIPTIAQAYQASIDMDKANTIDVKKEAIAASIIESGKG